MFSNPNTRPEQSSSRRRTMRPQKNKPNPSLDHHLEMRSPDLKTRTSSKNTNNHRGFFGNLQIRPRETSTRMLSQNTDQNGGFFNNLQIRPREASIPIPSQDTDPNGSFGYDFQMRPRETNNLILATNNYQGREFRHHVEMGPRDRSTPSPFLTHSGTRYDLVENTERSVWGPRSGSFSPYEHMEMPLSNRHFISSGRATDLPLFPNQDKPSFVNNEPFHDEAMSKSQTAYHENLLNRNRFSPW